LLSRKSKYIIFRVPVKRHKNKHQTVQIDYKNFTGYCEE